MKIHSRCYSVSPKVLGVIGSVALTLTLMGCHAVSIQPDREVPSDGALISARTAMKAEKSSLSQLIYEDCLKVNVILFKEQLEPPPNPPIAAHYLCQIVVGICRDVPGSEHCRKGIRGYDLKRGASGASALFEASHRGNTSFVRQLLEWGYDPNAPLEGPGWTGWTPLMIATVEKHDETVRILLDAGADPNAQNDVGRTSLMFASNYGDVAIADMLLDKGANPNVVLRDETGWTALMAAAAKGHSRVVQLLLERGADKSVHDKNGQTAVALAEVSDHSESARILRDFGKWR